VLGLAWAHGRLAPLAAARMPAERLRPWLGTGLAALLAAVVAVPTLAVNVHDWRDYRSDWSVQLLPDRPWLRYLDEHTSDAGLVEVLYPRQVYLSTGVHADSSLWLACAEAGRGASRAPFDQALARLRPDYVVAAGTPQDCVPDLIRGDPEYRQVFADRGDRVTIWARA
jgi:hypothetical protein